MDENTELSRQIVNELTSMMENVAQVVRGDRNKRIGMIAEHLGISHEDALRRIRQIMLIDGMTFEEACAILLKRNSNEEVQQ